MPRILLAEDDESMIYLLKTLFMLEGLEAITMNPEERVVDVIKRERPDAVLLDVHLHEANGMDIMRAIRQDETIHDTVVIMCSGMNLTHECLDAGANAFILKPYMPDELLNTIKKHLPA